MEDSESLSNTNTTNSTKKVRLDKENSFPKEFCHHVLERRLIETPGVRHVPFLSSSSSSSSSCFGSFSSKLSFGYRDINSYQSSPKHSIEKGVYDPSSQSISVIDTLPPCDESIKPSYFIVPHASSSFQRYDFNHHHHQQQQQQQQSFYILDDERCSDPVASILYSSQEDHHDEEEIISYFEANSNTNTTMESHDDDSMMNMSPPKNFISSKTLLIQTMDDSSSTTTSILMKPQVQRILQSSSTTTTTSSFETHTTNTTI